MDNIKWKNIFQFKDTMFFAQNNSTKVSISDGLTCVREYSKENVSGCAYNNETLWLSIENSNTLIAVDSENNEELIPILDYDNISIIKMVTGQESMLVLEGSIAKDKSLFVFDDVLINGVHGDSILRQIYFKNCDCVVVLLSPDYKGKNWTGHIEWSAIKELINTGNDDKICLLRVDSADIGSIDGLYKNQTIAKAIDDMSAPEIAAFIHQKYNMLI